MQSSTIAEAQFWQSANVGPLILQSAGLLSFRQPAGQRTSGPKQRFAHLFTRAMQSALLGDRQGDSQVGRESPHTALSERQIGEQPGKQPESLHNSVTPTGRWTVRRAETAPMQLCCTDRQTERQPASRQAPYTALRDRQTWGQHQQAELQHCQTDRQGTYDQADRAPEQLCQIDRQVDSQIGRQCPCSAL